VDPLPNGAGQERFTYRAAKLGLTAVGSLFVVASIGALAAGNPRWFGFVILALAILFMYVGLRGPSVLVTRSMVEVRGYFRTRRVSLASLVSAEVHSGHNAQGYPWEHLVLVGRDGTTTAYREVGAHPSNRKRTWVRAVAQAINDALSQKT
jgi:hypothetical protein